jgi:hypothetical protein
VAKPDDRKVLREALKQAIDGEMRFGRLDAARPDLDARWDKAIDELLVCLKRKTKR